MSCKHTKGCKVHAYARTREQIESEMCASERADLVGKQFAIAHVNSSNVN